MSRTNRKGALVATLVLLSALIVVSSGLASAAPAAEQQGLGSSQVNLNTAGTEQLTTIPGIGESMAQRIVEWRDEHGPFRRVEDLMKVKGIGEKSLEKLRPHVTVAEEQ
jgi:competence protein ComEA